MRTALTGWARTSPTVAEVRRPTSTQELLEEVVGSPHARGLLARGLGRSYGDAAQNGGGLILDTTSLDRVHTVDAERATVTVDAGVSLGRLVRCLAPFGLGAPVLPGTGHVTVGGAIAADVHGKNHHVDGSFGAHVLSMDLVTADGRVRALSPSGPQARLFWATLGGMGLTGIVTRATLRCRRIDSAYVVVDTERATDLDDLLSRLAGPDDAHPYSVAWFDSMARGDRLGRAVISRGRDARTDDLPRAVAQDPHRVEHRALGAAPARFPSQAINRWSARAFNELWYRRSPSSPRREVRSRPAPTAPA